MSGTTARISLRVSPGARSSTVVGRYGERWKVRVTAPPEDGRANEAVLNLLAEKLGVDRSRLRLVAGKSSRDKIVEVVGIDAVESERLLAATGEDKGDEGKRA